VSPQLTITMTSPKARPPWKKAAPKKTKAKTLTPSEKKEARQSAKKAGRPYPNLVDNMKVARKKE